MDRDRIEEFLGAYALDAVDDDERRLIEAFLETDPDARAEVQAHREAAAMLSAGTSPAPPAVWARIVAAIEPDAPRMRVEVDEKERTAAVLPLAPRHDEPREPLPSRINRALVGVAAVAAIVVALLAIESVRLDRQVDDVREEMAAVGLPDLAATALVDPGSRTADLQTPDGAVVAPAALTASGDGYLLAGRTPALDPSQTYQLWGVVGPRTISLGTFPGGTPVVAFRVDDDVRRLAVTKEVEGGVVASEHDAYMVADI